MIKYICYIEEYQNEIGNLCARLREKKSNRKIVIAGDMLTKDHFLRFLSAAKNHIEIMPTVYDRNGTDSVAIRGIIQHEDADTIELRIDVPGAGYVFE